MKRYFKILFMFIFVICLVGCGKEKTTLDVFNDSIEKYKETKSIKANLKAEVGISSENINIDSTFDLEMSVDNNTKVVKIDLKKNALLEDDYTFYASYLNDEFIYYYPASLIYTITGMDLDNEFWLKSKFNLNDIEDTTSEIALKDIKLEDYFTEKNFVYIDETDSIKHYQMVIDADTVINIMKKNNNEVNEEEIRESLKNPVKIDYYIDDNGYFIRFEIDLVDYISNLDNEEIEGLNKLNLVLTFNGINDTSVIIPEDVLNAIDTESE